MNAMKEFLNKFSQWYPENKGLFWGILIGLAIAILFLTIGFGATLLIIICVGVGAFLGTHPQVREMIANFFKSLFTRNKS